MVRMKKGFTLIELLVVIAIIGILSSVVLASLNSARGKGSDAAVKGAMDSLKAQAALYYDGAGSQSYDTAAEAAGACPLATGMWTDSQVKAIVANVKANAGTTVQCVSSSTAYAMYAQLKGGSGTGYWCVDSVGNSTGSSAFSGTGGCQ